MNIYSSNIDRSFLLSRIWTADIILFALLLTPMRVKKIFVKIYDIDIALVW